MSDGKKEIKELKKNEMQDIIDFYHFIEDYGHIFYDDPKVLDEPFKQILDGIEKVKQIVNENYEV
jgi:hypothetical protein